MKRVTVARRGDVAPGTCKFVRADGIGLALCRLGDRHYAVDNTCPHAGGPLAEGHVDGETIVCPWHGWRYDIRTGQRPENPEIAVPTYAVEEDSDTISVLLPPTA